MSSSFYIQLTSADDTKDYRNLTDFTSQLPTTLDLEGEWEVGLSQIITPNQFYNARGMVFTYYCFSLYGWLSGFVQDSYYADVSEVLEIIEEQLKRYGDDQHYKFVWNKTANVIELELIGDGEPGGGNEPEIRFSPTMGKFLGLEGIISGEGFSLGSPLDIHGSFSLFNIYTNIIEYSSVNRIEEPLLATVPVLKRNEGYGINYFQPAIIAYKRVTQSRLHHIAITLRNREREAVPFAGSGTIVLTLHFRRVNWCL